MLIRDCIFKGVIMERREDTPVRLARRKYEAKVKEKRREQSGTFGTMIPRTLFNEINAFLKENNITKVLFSCLIKLFPFFKQHLISRLN